MTRAGGIVTGPKMETIEPLLREHPFLQGLNDHQLRLLGGCAGKARFASGEYIFREGQEANASYLVRAGRASLEIHVAGRGPVQLHTVEAGEALGWSWLYPPYRWQFDARVVEPLRAIVFDGECLRARCESDHDLGYELVKRLLRQAHQRLEKTRLQLLDLYRTGL